VTLLIGLGGLLVGVILGIAVYGWITLPPDARVPIHYGLGSYGNFASKTVGLIVWPAAGFLVFGLLTAISEHAIRPDHPGSGTTPAIIMPILLVLVAATEWGAIATARRNGTLGER
jgi:hypothetical protein